jgi:hypothetical protein
MSSNQSTKKTQYAVVIIFSGWPLKHLCAFLEDELGADQNQIGVMRIDRNRGQETNRTILLIDRTLLDRAQNHPEYGDLTKFQKGLDFKITEYELRDHNYPKEGYTRNYYIPLPKALTAADDQAPLENKLEVLSDFGLFEKSRPRLKIPIVSRESGEHKGRGFVTFSRETTIQEIALGRILLHDTRLYTDEENYDLMKCFWAKARPPRSPLTKKGKQSKGRQMGKKERKPVPKKKVAQGKADQGKVPVIKPLSPGENQWDKPLTPLPPLGTLKTVKETDETESTESGNGTEESQSSEEKTEPTELKPPGPLDFPSLN